MNFDGFPQPQLLRERIIDLGVIFSIHLNLTIIALRDGKVKGQCRRGAFVIFDS